MLSGGQAKTVEAALGADREEIERILAEVTAGPLALRMVKSRGISVVFLPNLESNQPETHPRWSFPHA